MVDVTTFYVEWIINKKENIISVLWNLDSFKSRGNIAAKTIPTAKPYNRLKCNVCMIFGGSCELPQYFFSLKFDILL